MDKYIWVVDDDESIRWVLEKGLQDSGMDVQTFDSANKVIGVYSGKDIIIETQDTFSLKCTDFVLEASQNIDISSGVSTTMRSGMTTAVDGGTEMTLKAALVNIN